LRNKKEAARPGGRKSRKGGKWPFPDLSRERQGKEGATPDDDAGKKGHTWEKSSLIH